MASQNQEPRTARPAISRRKSALVYLAFNYAAFLLFLVQGLVLVPFYLRHVNAHLYGSWLATGNIISYFGVLDFGLTTVLVQRTASISGVGDSNGLRRILGTGLGTMAVLAMAPLILGLVLSQFVPGLVGIAGRDAIELVRAFRWAALGSSLMMMTLAVHGILLGLQRQLIPGIVGLIANTAGIATTILLFLRGYGISALPLGTIVRALVALSGFLLYSVPLLRRELGAWPSWDAGEFRLLWKQSFWTFSANLASSQCDNLVVGTLDNPVNVTILNITRKMGEFVAMMAKQVPSSLMPGISHLGGTGNVSRMQEVTMTLFRAALLLGIVGMGAMLVSNRSFVTLWVGAQYFGGDGVTLLVAIVGLLGIVGAAMNSTLYALGVIGLASRVTILEGACRALLAILLCRMTSYWGVLIAGILSAGLLSLPMQLTRYARELKIEPRRVFQDLAIPLCKGVIIVLVLRLVMGYLPTASTFIMLAVQGVVSAVFIAGILLGLDRRMRSCVRALMRRKVKETC